MPTIFDPIDPQTPMAVPGLVANPASGIFQAVGAAVSQVQQVAQRVQQPLVPVKRHPITGRSLDEITGTDYLSEDERNWYWQQKGSLPPPRTPEEQARQVGAGLSSIGRGLGQGIMGFGAGVGGLVLHVLR